MAEQIGVNRIKRAFDFKQISLNTGATKEIGRCSGLLIIRDLSRSSKPAFYLVNDLENSMTLIAGQNIDSLSFSWDSKSYGAKLSLVAGSNITCYIAYQDLSW